MINFQEKSPLSSLILSFQCILLPASLGGYMAVLIIFRLLLCPVAAQENPLCATHDSMQHCCYESFFFSSPEFQKNLHICSVIVLNWPFSTLCIPQ